LLQAAIEAGAPPEDALAFLERLNRLESVRTKPSRSFRGVRPFSLGAERPTVPPPVRWIVGVSTVAIVALMGVAAFAYWNRVEWRALAAWPQPPAPSPTLAAARELPPLPRRGEAALARATALAAGGKLSDALTVLDLVRPTDPQKPAADRLRAEIQRQLLALSTMSTMSATSAGTMPSAATRGTGRLP